MQSEYAKAGVDPAKIGVFEDFMKGVASKTLDFPRKRDVAIEPLAHGVSVRYLGNESYRWVGTLEGLGNKDYLAQRMDDMRLAAELAEWMQKRVGDDKHPYRNIAHCAVHMAANDCASHGAMPVLCLDDVSAPTSDWFKSKSARDLADGFYEVCESLGMAIGAGESAALRYLVKSAPVITCCVIGIVAPASRLITGLKMQAGDRIIGVVSSGLHSNGYTLLFDKVERLPEQFLTRLPNGRTIGDEALIPTRSYVELVEALLREEVEVHALLPGTGGGVSKLASDKRSFTYRIHSWPTSHISCNMSYMLELGVPLADCLTTFNWGVGYYAFVPPREVDRVIKIGQMAGYDLMEVGRVEEGDRKVIFGPYDDLVLPPPGT